MHAVVPERGRREGRADNNRASFRQFGAFLFLVEKGWALGVWEGMYLREYHLLWRDESRVLYRYPSIVSIRDPLTGKVRLGWVGLPVVGKQIYAEYWVGSCMYWYLVGRQATEFVEYME